MVVFTLLFGRLAKLPSDGIPPPIFYYAGLLPWIYFANAFNRSGNSLVTNTHLVTKVYFPRELIPAASVLTHLFDLAISFVLLLGLMLWYGTGFSWELLLWPVLVLPLTLFALGLGLWLSALNVKYRDVRHMIPFAVQIGMFVSPVAYSKRLVPESIQWLYAMNPAVGVIEACRATIMPDRAIDWALWGQAVAVGLLTVIVGFFYFRRTERTFADVI
jgi:lipopolysaccharide transport system permease protein